MAAMKAQNIGEYAFLGGILVAIIIGIFASMLIEFIPILLALLAIMGLLVGLLNITEKELPNFLIASIALLAIPTALTSTVSNLTTIPGFALVADYIIRFAGALAAFIAPACFVNAVKAIWLMAKSE